MPAVFHCATTTMAERGRKRGREAESRAPKRTRQFNFPQRVDVLSPEAAEQRKTYRERFPNRYRLPEIDMVGASETIAAAYDKLMAAHDANMAFFTESNDSSVHEILDDTNDAGKRIDDIQLVVNSTTCLRLSDMNDEFKDVFKREQDKMALAADLMPTPFTMKLKSVYEYAKLSPASIKAVVVRDILGTAAALTEKLESLQVIVLEALYLGYDDLYFDGKPGLLGVILLEIHDIVAMQFRHNEVMLSCALHIDVITKLLHLHDRNIVKTFATEVKMDASFKDELLDVQNTLLDMLRPSAHFAQMMHQYAAHTNDPSLSRRITVYGSAALHMCCQQASGMRNGLYQNKTNDFYTCRMIQKCLELPAVIVLDEIDSRIAFALHKLKTEGFHQQALPFTQFYYRLEETATDHSDEHDAEHENFHESMHELAMTTKKNLSRIPLANKDSVEALETKYKQEKQDVYTDNERDYDDEDERIADPWWYARVPAVYEAGNHEDDEDHKPYFYFAVYTLGTGKMFTEYTKRVKPLNDHSYEFTRVTIDHANPDTPEVYLYNAIDELGNPMPDASPYDQFVVGQNPEERTVFGPRAVFDPAQKLLDIAEYILGQSEGRRWSIVNLNDDANPIFLTYTDKPHVAIRGNDLVNDTYIQRIFYDEKPMKDKVFELLKMITCFAIYESMQYPDVENTGGGFDMLDIAPDAQTQMAFTAGFYTNHC